MTNPYAPPAATVDDIADPLATITHADRGTRLVAAILDGIVLGMLVYLPLGIAFAVTSVMSTPGVAVGRSGAMEALIASVAVGCVGFVVWAWLTVKYVLRNSQTIGKKMLNIKVVRTDGSPASFGRIFWLRNVVNMLLSAVPLYTIVDHLFIFGESRQCLHDKLADTIVIKA